LYLSEKVHEIAARINKMAITTNHLSQHEIKQTIGLLKKTLKNVSNENVDINDEPESSELL
jgi:hypothetical protein